MVAGLTLVCPVRGKLKAKGRSADGLQPSEERLRVEAIRHLVNCGYPKENFYIEAVIRRFGNSGRNSFRADFAVLDTPVSTIDTSDPSQVLDHALVLGEIKRDNADSKKAREYQVRPMLDFATRENCVALYWDNVEQRVFWKKSVDGRRVEHEGPLVDLPAYLSRPGTKQLTFGTINSRLPLLEVFKRIEDLLHSASIGPSKRFGIMMQLLLVKLYDEHAHADHEAEPLGLQDFAAIGVNANAAEAAVNRILKEAVDFYQAYLPEAVPSSLNVHGQTLLEVMKVLAPVKITSMRQGLIQEFYMYFARHIYKWDLAQYFTPPPVTDFIIEVLNPRPQEHVRDPACGSADFLTAAFRRGQALGWRDYASCIWGSDISQEAVQVAVLNMILNGDGKTNITHEDSLANINANAGRSHIVVCNPPFGTRIVENNPSTLANFDLGHEWESDKHGRLQVTQKLLKSQESGILFAEACLKLIKAGGRFALVVPNGYLGNRSGRYANFREWLLRNCRIAVIVGLPRFAFKGSGADVSASVIFCERREKPLAHSSESEDYEFSVEVVDRVGWNLGDKRAAPLYRRDERDGTLLFDDNDEPMLDSDFDSVLRRIRASDSGEYFRWLSEGIDVSEADPAGHVVSISEVLAEPFLTLDPKRNSAKMANLRREIMGKPYFRLGDVVDFLPESYSLAGKKLRIDAEKEYRLIEIADVGIGTYRWQQCRGWELPARAKHHAEPDDIYVGSIWSSVRKWFMASANSSDVMVTNGLHRLRLKPGMDDRLIDLVIGLCSEAYTTQMRGFARGSDGLAEVASADVADVVLPIITNPQARADAAVFVAQLKAGFTTIEAKASALFSDEAIFYPVPPPRPDHTSIV